MTTFTERLYARLPHLYRDADTDTALLRFLSLLGDQADELEQLINRIEYVAPDAGGTPGDTSDLTDPATADAAWLPWLAQLVGITFEPGITETQKRDAIADAVSSFRVGTRAGMTSAVQSVLTGTKYVRIHDHAITVPGDGGPWDVLIVTRGSESPATSAEVLAAALPTKPAGVLLHHRFYSASWTARAAFYPTWASRSGITWTQLMEADL